MPRRLISLLFVLSLSCAAAPELAGATSKSSKSKKSTTIYTPPKPPVTYPSEPESSEFPMISAGAALLVDAANGQILFAHNADEPRPVASTQKLLTGLIVAEEGNLDKMVTIERSDTLAEPTKLYLKPGERYRRSDLLRILLVKSMNDVARCLARDNAGSLEAFAVKMNAKARDLGMRNSHFVNPNGLPAPGQYSTPRDMSRLALFAYRNKDVRRFVSLRETTWRYNDGRVKNFENTNRVLKRWEYCNGLKTGYTSASGRCLISSATRGGRHMIALVFNDKEVWDDSYRMLAWGLAN